MLRAGEPLVFRRLRVWQGLPAGQQGQPPGSSMAIGPLFPRLGQLGLGRVSNQQTQRSGGCQVLTWLTRVAPSPDPRFTGQKLTPQCLRQRSCHLLPQTIPAVCKPCPAAWDLQESVVLPPHCAAHPTSTPPIQFLPLQDQALQVGTHSQDEEQC